MQVVSYSGGGLVGLVCVFLRGGGLVRWVCWLVLLRGCCQHLSFLVFGFWYLVSGISFSWDFCDLGDRSQKSQVSQKKASPTMVTAMPDDQ